MSANDPPLDLKEDDEPADPGESAAEQAESLARVERGGIPRQPTKPPPDGGKFDARPIGQVGVTWRRGRIPRLCLPVSASAFGAE